MNAQPKFSATQHTPGPWIDSQSAAMFATPQSYEKTSSEIAANARLIAAAPELLEALRHATAFLTANYADSDMPDILPACRTAIAKAEGRS